VFSDLITISSSKDRKRTINNIKTNLETWLKNQDFDPYRNAPLDTAMVLFIDKQRIKKQDVDNIAKIVLDALKKDDKYRRESYLFDDDSQLIRLLVYGIPRCEDDVYNTDTMTISFRE
jgi:Holliday junction resolvase RusA-like endonuclease